MKGILWVVITVLILSPVLGAEETETNRPEITDHEVAKAVPNACVQNRSGNATESIQDKLEGATEPIFLAGPCTISVECNCVDETISCSGPTGTCTSGGSGCDEWVKCGSQAKKYCPEIPSCPATCSTNSQCNSYCGGFGICIQGCCAC